MMRPLSSVEGCVGYRFACIYVCIRNLSVAQTYKDVSWSSIPEIRARR